MFQKPKYKRFKPKAKDRGRVTPATYQQVIERDNYHCQRCGRTAGTLDTHGIPITLELAHIISKAQGGTGEADNLLTLCGPSVNSGTCHSWVDYTAEGREWLRKHKESE